MAPLFLAYCKKCGVNKNCYQMKISYKFLLSVGEPFLKTKLQLSNLTSYFILSSNKHASTPDKLPIGHMLVKIYYIKKSDLLAVQLFSTGWHQMLLVDMLHSLRCISLFILGLIKHLRKSFNYRASSPRLLPYSGFCSHQTFSAVS